MFLALWSGVLILTCVRGQSTPECSQECTRFILDASNGPRVLRLFKELMMRDGPEVQKITMQMNGQQYELSTTKNALVENALKKGLTRDLLEKMFDYAAILPIDPEPTSMTTTSEKSSGIASKTGTLVGAIKSVMETATISAATSHPPSIARAGTMISPARYNVSTKDDGNVVLTIDRTNLTVPEELPKLSQIITDPEILMNITEDLKDIGVPIRRRGNAVEIGTTKPSPEDPTFLKIISYNGSLQNVVIMNRIGSYELPQEEDAFNRMLASHPQITYHTLTLLALHKVSAYIDQSHTFRILGLSGQPSNSTTLRSIPTTATPSILVGNNHFTFPRDWGVLKNQVEEVSSSAASIQRAIEMNDIACPPDVFVVIYKAMLKDFDDKLQATRKENEVGFNFGPRYLRLPQDAEIVANMMRTNLLACEFVRDSLVRIGVNSSKENGGLRVDLPRQQENCFLSNAPSFQMFDCKVFPQMDGSVQLINGPDSYTLPRDRASLQKALEERKVLPLEMIDAMKKSGIPAEMNYVTREVEFQNGSQLIRLPISMMPPGPAVFRLYSQGKPGSMSFVVEVGDAHLTLPRDIRKLNALILNSQVDPLRLVELFRYRTHVPYHFDTEKRRHVIVVNGKPLEFLHSPGFNTNGSSFDSSAEDGLV